MINDVPVYAEKCEPTPVLDPLPYVDAHHGKARRAKPVCTSCKFWPRKGYSQNVEDYA